MDVNAARAYFSWVKGLHSKRMDLIPRCLVSRRANEGGKGKGREGWTVGATLEKVRMSIVVEFEEVKYPPRNRQ